MTPQTEYTDDELTRLPQTTTVFEQPQLVMNDHEWLQQGYALLDNCPMKGPYCHPGSLPIPSGKLLIKTKGGYELVDERS